MKPSKGWNVSYSARKPGSELPHDMPDECEHMFVVVPSNRVTNKLVDDLVRKFHHEHFGWDLGKIIWDTVEDTHAPTGSALMTHVEGESGWVVHYIMTETEIYG